MALPTPPRGVRVVAGEIDSKVTTTRLIVPITGLPSWGTFRRVSESIATHGRQLPAHAHEREEVLTYVTEGFAAYQLGEGAPEILAQGAARLLTTPGKTSHRVSPAQGGAIRWFNLVLALPSKMEGAPRLQGAAPGGPSFEFDTVRMRPLVGANAPLRSLAGLECQEMLFTEDSATIPRVGRDRRGVVYVLSGEATVDEHPVSAGEAALIEGLPGVTVRGDIGVRALFATAPNTA